MTGRVAGRGAILAAALGLLAAGAPPAVAGKGTVELGISAEIVYRLIDDRDENLLGINLPLGASVLNLPSVHQGFRIGYFVSDAVSLEPSLGLAVLSDDDDTMLNLGVGLAALIHLDPTADGLGPFVGLGGNVTAVDWGGEGASQFGLMAEIGNKSRLEGDLASRVSLGVGRFFDSDYYNSHWALFASFGLSFFAGGGI